MVVVFSTISRPFPENGDCIIVYFKDIVLKNFIGAILSVLLISSFAFKDRSGIQGMIDPPEGAKRIWAVSGKDTVSFIPPPETFIMDVKQVTGSW